MAEATLSIAYAAIRDEIGEYLGYTRTEANWSTAQTAAVTSCLDSGLREFYTQADWEWSFMRELTTMVLWVDDAVSTTTVSGSKDNGTSTITASAATFYPSMVGREISITDDSDYTISSYTSTTVCVVSGDASGASGATFTISSNGLFRLPDDCQDIEGTITFAADSSEPEMVQWSEARIRAKRQWDSDTTGTPRYWAMVPGAFTETTGQRWDLLVWPIPDEDYTVTYRKKVSPDALAASQYVRGGAAHTETIIEACLATAELRYNDIHQGPHWSRYQELLKKSKEADARVGPDTLGLNSDNTRHTRQRGRHEGDYNVTVNGTQY